MTKIKNILVLTLFSLLIYACGSDSFTNPYTNIDRKALAISDNDSIVKFLQAHYYDETLDSVKALISGKTSIYEDSKLKIMDITENDIDYKLYVYVANEGSPAPNPDKGFPTIADSVFVKYSGRFFSGTTFSQTAFDSNTTGIWFTLNSVIKGWTNGMVKFKGGQLKKDPSGNPFNGPITFLNGGKGVIFIPSGLAYPSSNQQNISNSNLVNLLDSNLFFYVDLLDFVKDTDHDNDNVPSIVEDLNGDKNLNNDDTDGDGIPNYFDADDDGDGVLTKNEDKNGNGDPTDDKNDPTNPNLPDYLNKNIK
ncbi:MAG: peptidylprolyl isomerase [Flavobacteriia bacterium]|nr:peptidylprolyl isomerase [Flavobacteriia bacterium]OIP46560.1 MAG: peptidylprolyl isomerase [Flavobacteriaceae bacterium CG2_30_31_66]PIV95431.1 MAG: peptidylprolyl isomerase [Flavobacteriaceae bacterium CG17_big_fil_post_rev_8_21_14_2_50_31_13]PIY14084.1 MAG: peptidylprolyl isomerase [Flavobacteriaceae bacterium CG_4_10_14_3_um_filter_31_253]PIZ09404.1 MAG: peptidylprolyl isomerase [Flavobacteriaceae bacterium CG_4_10_14_0_8_um_filter_31_99]PJC10463.1 MAG: peptidylprolyl isomerase [Flavoba